MGGNLKGAIKTLEVVLAASILLVGLGFVFIPRAGESVNGLKHQGYAALEHMDNTGQLGYFARSDDANGANSALGLLISYKFKAVFCRQSCDKAGIPDKANVVVIDYYVSGYPAESGLKSDPKKLRLYIWE